MIVVIACDVAYSDDEYCLNHTEASAAAHECWHAGSNYLIAPARCSELRWRFSKSQHSPRLDGCGQCMHSDARVAVVEGFHEEDIK